MNSIIRNIVAVVVGIVIGSAVNIGIVTVGPAIIPPPAGVNPMDMESIAANMHLYEPVHFVVPLLAHALGTLVGVIVAFFIAVTNRATMAYVVGAVFFVGGVTASFMLPAPMWFIGVDLVFAYFPMAWLGATLSARLST